MKIDKPFPEEFMGFHGSSHFKMSKKKRKKEIPFTAPSGMTMNYRAENRPSYTQWDYKESFDHANELGV